jgi:uncharacterized protein
MATQDFDNLREKLNGLNTWPSIYLFKFIFLDDAQKTDQILELFDPKVDVMEMKSSASGKYNALSVRKHVNSAEEIIAVYESVAKIEGVISL